MGTIKRIFGTVGLVMLVAVAFYFPMDWMKPYVFPVSLTGIILTLGIAIYFIKKSGIKLFMLLLGLCLLTSPAWAVYKPKECNDSFKGGGLYLDENLDIRFDFKDKEVLNCVKDNMIKMGPEICKAADELKRNKELTYEAKNLKNKNINYDMEIRVNCFYVINYYRLMTLWEARGTDEAYRCARQYNQMASMIDKILDGHYPTIGQTLQKGADNCWPCNLAGLFIGAVQLMAGNIYSDVQYMAYSLLGIIFLFWIAFRVLKFIGAMGTEEPAEFMGDLLMRFIVVAIAAALLNAPIVDFYRIAISPFIGLTTVFSEKLSEMSMTDGRVTFAEAIQTQMGIKPENVCESCALMKDPDYTFPGTEGQIEVMDAQSVNGLLCLVCQAYQQVMPFIAIGESFNGYANNHMINVPGTPFYIPDFMYLVIGYILVILFSILAVIIAFYVLDAILRLGFVVVLTPLFITAWAFPISREYSTKAWHLFLSCLLQFIAVAVMMALFLNVILQILPGEPSALMTAIEKNDIQAIFRVFTGVDSMSGAAAWVGGGAIAAGSPFVAAAAGAATMLFLFILIGFVFMAIKMLTASEQIIQSLSGISVGIPSLALGALTSMVQEGIKLATMGVGGAKRLMQKGAEAMKGGKKPGGKGSGGKSAKKGRFKPQGIPGVPSGAPSGGSGGAGGNSPESGIDSGAPDGGSGGGSGGSSDIGGAVDSGGGGAGGAVDSGGGSAGGGVGGMVTGFASAVAKRAIGAFTGAYRGIKKGAKAMGGFAESTLGGAAEGGAFGKPEDEQDVPATPPEEPSTPSYVQTPEQRQSEEANSSASPVSEAELKSVEPPKPVAPRFFPKEKNSNSGDKK